MTKKLLLIDGDEMVFKATSAIEQEVRWDECNHVLWSNPEHAWENFEGIIHRLFDRFDVEPESAVICFSGTYKVPNFRLAIDETYKGHRSKDRKPMCYWDVRERCVANYVTKDFPGLEADDVMGILATKPGAKHRIIVSQDKDMKTIPTTVWNGKDLVTYSEAEADYWHLYQTLIGDTADGYKGCPKFGPVKAEKLLTFDHESVPAANARVLMLWGRVVGAYQKAGLTEADALAQARLARILRWTDWDTEKKEPILWTPSTASC